MSEYRHVCAGNDQLTEQVLQLSKVSVFLQATLHLNEQITLNSFLWSLIYPQCFHVPLPQTSPLQAALLLPQVEQHLLLLEAMLLQRSKC